MSELPEVTPDGRYLVIGGRRWRATDPAIPQKRCEELTQVLMAWRREVRRTRGTADERAARAGVHAAKLALGERGTPWWEHPTNSAEPGGALPCRTRARKVDDSAHLGVTQLPCGHRGVGNPESGDLEIDYRVRAGASEGQSGREQGMIEIKSRLKSVADREKWAARGASFVTKAKATKVVWFPPKPVETGEKVASTAKKTTKKATKRATGAGRKTTKKTASAATKTTNGLKNVTTPVRRKKT